jgi:hypothetical protein
MVYLTKSVEFIKCMDFVIIQEGFTRFLLDNDGLNGIEMDMSQRSTLNEYRELLMKSYFLNKSAQNQDYDLKQNNIMIALAAIFLIVSWIMSFTKGGTPSLLMSLLSGGMMGHAIAIRMRLKESYYSLVKSLKDLRSFYKEKSDLVERSNELLVKYSMYFYSTGQPTPTIDYLEKPVLLKFMISSESDMLNLMNQTNNHEKRTSDPTE